MSQTYTIRPALRADVPAILTLVRELAAYEKAPDEVTVTLEHFEQTGFGANPVWWALVAEDAEGTVVGIALYYIRFSTWKGATMYLEDLVVRESYRGQGIGAALFDRLIAIAREQGYQRISWQVLDWNEPAIHFYKKYNTHFDPEWVNCSINL